MIYSQVSIAENPVLSVRATSSSYLSVVDIAELFAAISLVRIVK